MRVLIADDSVLLREGLQHIMADAQHEVVGSVGDGDTLVSAYRTVQPDIAIVDVRMPPTHTDEGLQAAAQIRAEFPDAKIMMLSQYVEVSCAAELLAHETGGTGYLLKDRVTDIVEFIRSLERVARGGTAIDPQVVKQLLGGPKQHLQALTPRERETLALMAEGCSNQAIAEKMCITLGAVEKNTQRIFLKLELPAVHSENRRVRAVLAYLQQHR